MTTLVQGSIVSLYDRWHSGERKIQDLMHVREAVQDMSSIMRPSLTTQMQEFVPGLNYFFIGTLDDQGRPWVSILTGPKGFLQSPNSKCLEIRTRITRHSEQTKDAADPIFFNLARGETFKSGKRMWGAVALDFSNRRRNKMNGVVYPDGLLTVDETSGELQLKLTVEQSIGNCPKYITIREMKAQTRSESTDSSNAENVTTALEMTGGSSLGIGDQEIAIIRQADCFFIASRFIDENLADQTSGMDCNHRGGNPGFVRLGEDNKSLVFPDYSGNRFFNTLGNIANDERVGILFISFETGDLLHITGRAKIFVGKGSQALYPHTQRCVQVTIDGHLLRNDAIPFRMHTRELSPYNPIVPSGQKRTIEENLDSRVSATLSRITKHTRDISTFHFNTSGPIRYSPGQYAVLDFSQFNTVGYRHMAPDDPQSLNDDYIRTWTISSAPLLGTLTAQGEGWQETSEFTMTIKRKPGGAVSNFLHNLPLESLSRPFTVPLVSTGGNFVFPGPTSNSITQSQSPVKFALISGGIGSTPFISMIRGAKQLQHGSIDIKWVNSVPYFEDSLPEILREIVEVPQVKTPSGTAELKTDQPLNLSIEVFLSRANPTSTPSTQLDAFQNVRFHFERLGTQALLATIPDLQDRDIFLCGPEPFMEATKGYLKELGVPLGRIQTEAFNF
ncbi:hypothetical protein BGZ80_008186 [Entomortierella chlamydospora]|uniref:FAD-binding FR-type domain-containing protein n=1 Tax=Entomortierella chlamydospora TaxID=101097 RepID=A0A9P6MYD4_9FUNG|nr:hypothetical protein BGZ79_005347 [Entomortierella chlamydospora]KAG0017532.1 hypothetical protein BGZ80_008186 [Entomortierella chlamydospora]